MDQETPSRLSDAEVTLAEQKMQAKYIGAWYLHNEYGEPASYPIDIFFSVHSPEHQLIGVFREIDGKVYATPVDEVFFEHQDEMITIV